MKARLLWLSKLGEDIISEVRTGGGADYPPPITTGTPNVFHFSATLHKVLYTVGIRGLPPWLDKIQGGSQNLMWNSLHVLNPHTYLCSM